MRLNPFRRRSAVAMFAAASMSVAAAASKSAVMSTTRAAAGVGIGRGVLRRSSYSAAAASVAPLFVCRGAGGGGGATGRCFVESRRRALAFFSHPFSSSSSSAVFSLRSKTTSRAEDDRSGDVSSTSPFSAMKINIHTVPKSELESLVTSWGFPKYRASQILKWVRDKGASSFDDMSNLPTSLRQRLTECARIGGGLEVAAEWNSVDGTKKRAYRLYDGQLIESVLMRYDDGRNTACISSQAGCAMGCVFCATGQMGFARQLSSDEIFEQVALFASEIKRESNGSDRLTNVVLMGMGEPLANYRNVMTAIRRIKDELNIGARRITVSTVGVVPNIRKLATEEKELQVKLAVSLHCATEEERSDLMPANRRYGGIDELMSAVRHYVDATKRRVTFEWALIEGTNDSPDVARSLGRLLMRHGIRRDMAHVNVIPLNPTGGYKSGRPSKRGSVAEFVRVLDEEFGIGATPRMRRGIDIDAGCGQLKAAVKRMERSLASSLETAALVPNAETGRGEKLQSLVENAAPTGRIVVEPIFGVYEEEEEEEYGADDEEEHDEEDGEGKFSVELDPDVWPRSVDFDLHQEALDLDEYEGEVICDDFDQDEADRLIELVRGSFPAPPLLVPEAGEAVGVRAMTEEEGAALPMGEGEAEHQRTTTITDEGAIREAKRRRKKLLKNIRMIERLREIEASGQALNGEQIAKVAKEGKWRAEVESLEHNLK